jgi:sec-independent protein translocase protein TatA
MIGTTEITLLVGAAVLLFGVDKLPKLARSAGQVKKEFMVGQAEADIAAETAREEARKRAAAAAAAAPITAPPVEGTPVASTVEPPHTSA